jgi:hypothetical protein
MFLLIPPHAFSGHLNQQSIKENSATDWKLKGKECSMGKEGLNHVFGQLVLQRCDELEEDAVAMAREVVHLRNMLALVLAETGDGKNKITKEQMEGLLNEKKSTDSQ